MGFLDDIKGELFNKLESFVESQPAKPAASAPETPAPPVLQYFVAANGQQTGPFNAEHLKEMAVKGELKKESLVWKTGMPAWLPAAQVTELSAVFASAPPPLPGAAPPIPPAS